jgi:hypothetical protein
LGVLLLGSLVIPRLGAAVEIAQNAPGLRFVVTLPRDDAATRQASSGRLFVFLSTRQRGEPRRGPNWFKPDPFFALEVRDWQRGDARELDDAADGFPASLSKLPPGKYRAQAVLDCSLDHHNPGTAPGNLYSDVAVVEYEPAAARTVPLALTQTIEERSFRESDFVKQVRLKSDLLSRFHGREIIEPAAVVLPRSYWNEPDRRYPVIYSIPGFGGDYRDAQVMIDGGPPPAEGEAEFIRVYLSGDCRWGHHVYANSATNGPRGDAFVREMVPYIDQHYRTVAAPAARFLTGHSSGGWASLWLVVNYPEHFGGAWSTSPDPVDFRDFQQINLYALPPVSMFVDEQGNRRPIARRGDEPVLWFDSFCRMDDVLARGGQLRSFEAVFSPRGADGEPSRLWNRTTGRVDPAIAKAWEAYDIRLILERNWDRLGPLLAGKIHVWTGSLDTFYLEGAVRLLKESLQRLGSDAQITIVSDANHATILTAELMSTIRRQMTARFKAAEARATSPIALERENQR